MTSHANTGAIEDFDALGELSLFRGVDLSRFRILFRDAVTREINPGDVLLEKGQESPQVFVLLDGRLSVHTQLDGDAIALLERGDVVGDMSVVSGQAISAFVRADTHCRLLELTGEALWTLFDEDRAFARNLLTIYARRIANLNLVVNSAQRLQQEYRVHATTDPLTGLYNRRWLNESLAFEISRAQLRKRPLTVMVADIDHFKQYNDEHGHVAGDQALKAVADAVLVALRGSDMAVRYGGEEIVVVLPGADVIEAHKVADRLHRAVDEQEIVAHDDAPLPPVTISIGLASMINGDSPEQLIARADDALYRAKANGRNCTAE
jgi:diguanylate cyclase (GGDEF)-like protein